MKLSAPHTQHAALVGGIAALVCWRVSFARTMGERSHPATPNPLTRIAARI